MPQSTPAGGLSLIIHIMINIVIYLYNKIVKDFKLAKKNFVSNFFVKLTNKKGDNKARRLLSYSLASFVFVVMTTNFIMITTRLYRLEDTRITTKIESIIAQRYPSNDSYTVSNEMMTNNINYTPLLSNQNQMDFDVPIIEKLSEKQFTSLVDFMESLGIVNTSFEARAELAKQTGVVSEVDQYDGSLEQNKKIIKKIQDELRSHIKPV